jgi:acetyltransferase-like isoleucine patch superfamily enzyme
MIRSSIRALRQTVSQLQSALTHLRIRLKYPHVQVGKNVRFYGPIDLNIHQTATVRIGDNCTFRSATRYNFVGINRPVSIYAGAGATLAIGDDCGFSGTAIVAVDKIVIESFVLLGGNSSVWDTDFHPLDYQLRRIQIAGTRTAPILIKSDAFIGANAHILKGSTIGERTVVGAGSVVSGSLPADEIWAGNPARFIRSATGQRSTPAFEHTMPLLTR